MADVKFSELTSLSTTASADILAVVDSSESASKQLTIDNLFGAVPVNLAVTDVTQSTSNTTGLITTTGGVGVSKDVYVGGVLNVFGDTNISSANTNITTGTVDIDANVVIYNALTVNSTSALIGGGGINRTLYFRDDGLGMNSPTNGTLDLFADTIFEITAPTTNVIATTAVTIHTPAISANGTFTIGADDTGYDVIFYTATTGSRWWIDESADTMYANVASVFGGAITVGVDDAGKDVTFYGDTASSQMLWDTSDDQMEFGNATMTFSDARTSGTATITGLTIDMYNKLDTGSSNDRIGAAISTYGDTNAYTIRDSVGIRAMSRQSTGAEVTRLNTPLHSVLDLANTAIANNSGTTLSGAYGLVIDHDDTIATRTGQPTAFISFGEMYVGGTTSLETAYLFDIFPNGKTGDATYATAADVAFYNDGAQYATTRDTMLLNSSDGAPESDIGDHILMEPDPFDAILLESGTASEYEYGETGGFITTESGESVVLEDYSQDNPTGFGNFILFETGSQDADGVLKIRVNGEDKYIQLYNLVS